MKKWNFSVIVSLAALAGCGTDSGIVEDEALQNNSVETALVSENPDSQENLFEDPDEASDKELDVLKVFHMPSLEIFEVINPYAEKSAGILSLEEAATIGAEYIWDMIKYDLNGLSLQLSYSNPPGVAGSWWSGKIGSSRAALENLDIKFMFLIDAHTGQRVDFTDIHTPENRLGIGNNESGNSLMLMPSSPQTEESGNLDFEAPNREQLLHYQSLAAVFAKRHFHSTQMTDIIPHPTLVFNPMGTLTFLATDETGRIAEITIQMETEALMRITTQHNDNHNVNVTGGTG